MKFVSLQQGNWRQGLAAACESLVHPAVSGQEMRRAHARLLGMLFAMPFAAGAFLVQLLHDRLTAPALLALLCVTFAGFWLAAAGAAATRNTGAAIASFLAVLAVLIGLVVGATGGLASPLLFLLLAPAFEMWWLGRKPAPRGWYLAGGALVIALAVQAILVAVPFSAGLWLVPASYGLSAWLRLGATREGEEKGEDRPAVPDLDSLARISGNAVLQLDRQGHVEAMHGWLAERLGVEPIALAGSGLFGRLHVTDRLFYLATLDAVRTGGKPAEIRLRLRTAENGAYRLFTLVASPGESGACIACLRDCAELESLQRKVASAEARIAAFEQAKGRFLATVSHELRTPLNAIIGFADMLDNEIAGPLPDPRQKDYVRLIGESGQHLLAVVNAILDVSKIESGNYEVDAQPFPVEEAIDMCLSMMQLQAGNKQIRLLRRIGASVDTVRADKRAVQQMLINLVSNAVKFTPEGGRIELAAETSDTHLVLRVRDNGIGMASADLARIGRPFVQVQRSDQEQGSGLGLHLVKGLVSLHDGSMEIDSAPSLGTAVTIRLPLDGPSGAPVHRLWNRNSGRQEAEQDDAAEQRCA